MHSQTVSPPIIKIGSEPLHAGRISPFLYGSFIELWDDHVVGMWSEMLNDRGFEGVLPRVNWCYSNGEPNVCDRRWNNDPSFRTVETSPFNGPKCAEVQSPGKLSQSDLYVRQGTGYHFSGYFKGDGSRLRLRLRLKALLPDQTWMTLAEKSFTAIPTNWTKLSCQLLSKGTTDRTVFEIEVEGKGKLWIDKVSLMPNDNVRGWRKDVVEAIKELGSPIIRWGGCVVDPGYYKWKNCVGSRDLRQPFENVYWGRIDSNDVGIDEFLQFCESVGAEPLVCLSFQDGAQSAADLVRYCNEPETSQWGKERAKNGHPKPYGVRYWQIGNELEGEEYARGFMEISKAVHAVDPSAIILTSFPSPDLFKKISEQISFVCPHFYRDDWDNIEKEIRDAHQRSKALNPSRSVSIGVTEWNFTNPFDHERSRLLSLESALASAKFLNLFHRNSDVVTLACRSNMCNSLGDGVIQTRPSGLLKPPAYHVLKLYRLLSKPVPVKVDGLPDGVEASACRTEIGDAMTVFFINFKSDPITVHIDASSYSKSLKTAEALGVGDIEDARQIDLQNHWTAPDRIRTFATEVKGNVVTLPALSVTGVTFRGS